MLFDPNDNSTTNRFLSICEIPFRSTSSSPRINKKSNGRNHQIVVLQYLTECDVIFAHNPQDVFAHHISYSVRMCASTFLCCVTRGCVFCHTQRLIDCGSRRWQQLIWQECMCVVCVFLLRNFVSYNSNKAYMYINYVCIIYLSSG